MHEPRRDGRRLPIWGSGGTARVRAVQAASSRRGDGASPRTWVRRCCSTRLPRASRRRIVQTLGRAPKPRRRAPTIVGVEQSFALPRAAGGPATTVLGYGAPRHQVEQHDSEFGYGLPTEPLGL